MNMTDWIGYFVSVAIVFAIGYWLHRVGQQPKDDRIESLALWAGGSGIVVVGIARLAGVA
jgi:membrane protein DedA with SNARE-associated domain